MKKKNKKKNKKVVRKKKKKVVRRKKKKVLKNKIKLKKNKKKFIKKIDKNKKLKIKKNKLYKKKQKNKTRKPLDRLRTIKFRIPKIKKRKIKLASTKKKIIKIKKYISQAVRLIFQKVLNFILTPIFSSYDNYHENKKLKKLKEIAIEKKEKEKLKREEARARYESKKQELAAEVKLAKEREYDLKKFIRVEQAILRKEQAKKRRQFLEEIKLSKKIESFRKRELEEIKNLEKLALKEERDDYRQVEERLEKIKDKYRQIRDQKVRERVEALGLETSDLDSKEDLLKKESEYAEQRQTIELVLESFYRSANALVFQLNKKFIPKHKSILRCINRLYETSEAFIRYDDSPDEDWLILIYLEDSDAKKGKIIVENKTNPEKHETKSFETKEIFAYSDYLVDSMAAHIDRERQKKPN